MVHTGNIGSLAGLTGLTTIGEGRANAVKPQGVHTPVALDQAKLSAAGGLASQPDTDVRWEKVQALQAAIQGGTYQVSASDVASKIVDSLLERQGN